MLDSRPAVSHADEFRQWSVKFKDSGLVEVDLKKEKESATESATGHALADMIKVQLSALIDEANKLNALASQLDEPTS